MDRIFIESSEEQGLLYDRYNKIPERVENFLNFLDECIGKTRKNGVPDVDITSRLEEFKGEITMDMKNPKPIDMGKIKTARETISNTRKKIDSLIDHLAKTRKRYKFGDNVLNGVISKPKIYGKGPDRDDEFLYKTNKFMRDVGRSLDWVEKITLDLLNLADQDLNLLSLVSRVYFKKIAESAWDDNIMNQEIFEKNIMDEEITEQWESWFEDAEEDDSDDLLNETIPKDKNKDEKYYPIFCIALGFDLSKGKCKDLDDRQKQMIKLGKMFKTISGGEKYTHTLISLDTSFEHLIHFLGTGFNRDNILTGSDYMVTDSIYVTVCFLTKEEMDAVKKVIKDLEENKEKTGYNINQILGMLIGKGSHKDKNFLCSCAVGYILSRANVKYLSRDFAFIRPEDMTILPRSFYVIQFKDRDDFVKRKAEFEKRVDQIYKDNIDEIREYNNELPKTLIQTSMKKNNTFDKFLMSVMKKINAN